MKRITVSLRVSSYVVLALADYQERESLDETRQVRVARLLESTDVDFGHDDVIDVHVTLCARERHHAVATSDPDDFRRVDPNLRLIHT